MRRDGMEKLLNRVRRRLWLQGLIERGWLGFMLAVGVLALAAVVHMLQLAVTPRWWGPAAVLPLVWTALAAAFDRPSLATSARAADRWLDTHDLLTAAWYLRSQAPPASSVAARVVLEQAHGVATDTSRSLPRPGSSGHALPRAIAIAVAAASLFFLSLPGAAPSGSLPGPAPEEARARDGAAADYWLSGAESGLPDESPAVMAAESLRKPPGRTVAPSAEPQREAAPPAPEREHGEPGSGSRANRLQAAQGAGASGVTSAERPAATDGDAPGSEAVLGAVERVAVQRRPAGGAAGVDRTTGAGLLPSASNVARPVAVMERAPAARAAAEPFSPTGGPAYRALQARYAEETSDGE